LTYDELLRPSFVPVLMKHKEHPLAMKVSDVLAPEENVEEETVKGAQLPKSPGRRKPQRRPSR
jgi:hypothetical protein